MIWKGLRKIIHQLLLICSISKKNIPAYILKHDSTHEKHSLNDSKQRKRRMASCRNIITYKKLQNIKVIFIVWVVLILLEQKSHEKVCKNKDFCGIVIPTEKKKILEFNQYMKSDKVPYIIYANIESLIIKMDVQVIQRNLQQWKYTSIFLVDIQFLQFGDVII